MVENIIIEANYLLLISQEAYKNMSIDKTVVAYKGVGSIKITVYTI